MAARHLVICPSCGKQFDANEGGSYDEYIRRYTCPSCVAEQQRISRNVQIRQETVQTQEVPAPRAGRMIWKLAVGALFVIASFQFITDVQIGPLLTGLVVGAGFIAWGLVPYLAQKKAHDASVANRAAEIRTAEERIRIETERALNAPRICPACGATTKGQKCEYCGTPLK